MADYATLDLLAHHDFGGGVSANLGLFNRTGAEYIEWCDVRGRANGDPLIPYYRCPGRNVSLTLRWGL
jgi:outer membrane receptor protein involved in Fe transport